MLLTVCTVWVRGCYSDLHFLRQSVAMTMHHAPQISDYENKADVKMSAGLPAIAH